MFKKTILFALTCMLTVPACKQTIELTQVDYSHKLESVLKVSENGTIEDIRHGITLNISPILNDEGLVQSHSYPDQIRLIRNTDGFYFLTAINFHHVYVLESEIEKLVVHQKIKVSENGLEKPFLNWRAPYVVLNSPDFDEPVLLNNKAIKGGREL